MKKIAHGIRCRAAHSSEHDLASLLAALIVLIVITDILLTRAM